MRGRMIDRYTDYSVKKHHAVNSSGPLEYFRTWITRVRARYAIGKSKSPFSSRHQEGYEMSRARQLGPSISRVQTGVRISNRFFNSASPQSVLFLKIAATCADTIRLQRVPTLQTPDFAAESVNRPIHRLTSRAMIGCGLSLAPIPVSTRAEASRNRTATIFAGGRL